MEMAKRLQENDDERHDGLDEAKLQRGLLAEPQEADGVGFAHEAAGSVDAARSNRLAANFAHDVAFSAEVLVAQT